MSVSALSSAAPQLLSLIRPGSNAQGAVAPAGPPPPRGPGAKEKMEQLLSGQVGAGTLSQGQADTLKSFFENLASPPKDVRSDRGPDGAKGPPPRREDKVDAKGSTDARLPVDPAGDPAASAVSQAIADALAAFLKNLQASNSATKGYGTFANTMPTTPSVVMDKTI